MKKSIQIILLTVGAVLVPGGATFGILFLTSNKKDEPAIISSNSIINKIEESQIRRYDGINNLTDLVGVPKEKIVENINNYLKNVSKIKDWAVKIKDFQLNSNTKKLQYTIVLTKKDNSLEKEIKVEYSHLSFKTSEELKELEQNKINQLTKEMIISSKKIKDYSNYKTTKEFTVNTQEQNPNLEKAIQNYVDNLEGVSNWKVQVAEYKANPNDGSVQYKILITKEKFNQHTINVSFPKNTFQTISQLKSPNQIAINKLSANELLLNDEIKKASAYKMSWDYPSRVTKYPQNLKDVIKTYINNIEHAENWDVEIVNYNGNTQLGSLIYTLKIFQTNFFTREIMMKYPANTFMTIKKAMQKEQQIINQLEEKTFMSEVAIKEASNYEITLDHPIEITNPKPELQTSIQNLIDKIENTKNWKVEILNYKANVELGRVTYKIKISKPNFVDKEIIIYYPANSFKKLNEWLKENEETKINALTKEIIMANDGIQFSASYSPLSIQKHQLESLIQKYVNSLDGVTGWVVKTNDLNINDETKSFSYKLHLSKTGFTKKEITIQYPNNSFEIAIDDFKKKINQIKNSEIINHDGIKSSTTIFAPDLPPSLQINIDKFIQSQLKNKNKWKVVVSGYKVNHASGSLSYKATIKQIVKYDDCGILWCDYGVTREDTIREITINYPPNSFKKKTGIKIKEIRKLKTFDLVEEIKLQDGVKSSKEKLLFKELGVLITTKITLTKDVPEFIPKISYGFFRTLSSC